MQKTLKAKQKMVVNCRPAWELVRNDALASSVSRPALRGVNVSRPALRGTSVFRLPSSIQR